MLPHHTTTNPLVHTTSTCRPPHPQISFFPLAVSPVLWSNRSRSLSTARCHAATLHCGASFGRQEVGRWSADRLARTFLCSGPGAAGERLWLVVLDLVMTRRRTIYLNENVAEVLLTDLVCCSEEHLTKSAVTASSPPLLSLWKLLLWNTPPRCAEKNQSNKISDATFCAKSALTLCNRSSWYLLSQKGSSLSFALNLSFPLLSQAWVGMRWTE